MSVPADPTMQEAARVLARMVGDGQITEAQAVSILRRVIAGEVELGDLPEPPERAIRGIEAAAVAAALALLRSNFAPGWEGAPQVMNGRAGILARYRNLVQEDFATTVRGLASDLADGRITLPQWQAKMADEVTANLLQQTMLGAGSAEIDAQYLLALDADVRRQMAFLSRFVDQIALARLDGTPMSEAAIGSRSELYSGQGYGEWFRSAERAWQGDYGYVVYYRAHDDATTCGICGDNAIGSPYLPVDGPYPGIDCLGRSRCRCWREVVFDEEAYQLLVGGSSKGGTRGTDE